MSIDGKYTVTLFDYEKNDWQAVTVDDLIPTQGGRAAFTKPNGGENWVMILEKAFAKFVGSYAAISGGNPGYAWMAFSGCKDGVIYWPPTHANNNNDYWLRLHLDCDKTIAAVGSKDPLGLQFYYGPAYG